MPLLRFLWTLLDIFGLGLFEEMTDDVKRWLTSWFPQAHTRRVTTHR